MDNQLCGPDMICIDSSLCMCETESSTTLLPNLATNFFSQAKSMEELKQALVLTHMELEATRKRADQELRNRDHQLTHLKFLLSQAKEQTDDSQTKFKTLISQTITLHNKLHHLQTIHNNQITTHPPPLAGMGFDYQDDGGLGSGSGLGLDTEKLLFHQTTSPPPPLPLPLSGISTVEDNNNNNNTNNGFSFSSDSDESIVSSPVIPQDPTTRLLLNKPLPEQGKLLMAVMNAGPLLQTLLLAGPLPQWHHPPPPLDSYQIPPPPVVVPSSTTNPSPPLPPQEHLVGKSDDCVRMMMMMRKREVCPDFDFALQNKRPRVVLSHN